MSSSNDKITAEYNMEREQMIIKGMESIESNFEHIGNIKDIGLLPQKIERKSGFSVLFAQDNNITKVALFGANIRLRFIDNPNEYFINNGDYVIEVVRKHAYEQPIKAINIYSLKDFIEYIDMQSFKKNIKNNIESLTEERFKIDKKINTLKDIELKLNV